LKVAAFFFDLDRTLIDTEALWTRAIVDFLAARGVSATFDEVVPQVIGRNWIDIDRSLHERYPAIGDTTILEDAEELRRYFKSYAADPESMKIPGSIEFLKRAAAVAPVAIVSGSPRDDVLKAVGMCGISEHVGFVLGGGDYPQGKPSPSGYLKAAELLGVEPSDCVVIEDSSVGVRAGAAAGMKVLALDRRTDVPQDFSAASWRFQDLSGVSPEDLV
jgi:HAD superfamily hydrolase (TIGR01509 family)